VDEQLVLGARREAALLAHVQLVAPLLVGVLLRDAVDLLHVGLQGAALGERLVAQRALVRPDAWLDDNNNNKSCKLPFYYVFFSSVHVEGVTLWRALWGAWLYGGLYGWLYGWRDSMEGSMDGVTLWRALWRA